MQRITEKRNLEIPVNLSLVPELAPLNSRQALDSHCDFARQQRPLMASTRHNLFLCMTKEYQLNYSIQIKVSLTKAENGEECEVAQHKLLANRCAPLLDGRLLALLSFGKNPAR